MKERDRDRDGEEDGDGDQFEPRREDEKKIHCFRRYR
jgi:hypothetical protein